MHTVAQVWRSEDCLQRPAPPSTSWVLGTVELSPPVLVASAFTHWVTLPESL